MSAESRSARQGSRILIVEDDLEIARMLGDTLT
ncbi:DNA-binding response regulator, partial [Mesorhizobium sp. M7A.F.Ca.CA.001.08.1.1]